MKIVLEDRDKGFIDDFYELNKVHSMSFGKKGDKVSIEFEILDEATAANSILAIMSTTMRSEDTDIENRDNLGMKYCKLSFGDNAPANQAKEVIDQCIDILKDKSDELGRSV